MEKLIKINENLEIKIECISPSIFRVRASSNDNFSESGLNRYGIIKKNLPEGKANCEENNEKLIIFTTEATLKIDKKIGVTTFLDKAGKTLLAEKGSSKSEFKNGFSISFELSEDERLYGFGDENRERINKRGHKNIMAVRNVASYAPIPFVMSDKGWGLFMNTTWYHSFDAGAEEKNTLSFHADKGFLDYYFIAGSSLPELLDKYTDLTGKPYMLPKWGYALTYVNDEREVRAKDVLTDAYEFRRNDIPCDVMGLEPGWMEERYDYSVDKKWSEKRFHIPFWLKGKNHGTFHSSLRNMGFRMSLWLCCDYDLSEYEESLINGQKTENVEGKESRLEEDLIKDPHFHPQYMDKLTKPGEAWFEHLKKFVDDGAEAFKLDGANQICFHPDRKWRNGMEDAEMHNLYPVLLSKQMTLGYEGHAQKRAMVFTAGGYAGTQQYSATWAGDTGGGKKPLVSLLNHGLSGHSNACSDMDVHTDAGIHFGFLQALSQAFSWHMYNQPWFFPKERFAMYKDYAKLRYRIMPYIYSMAHVAAKTAMPIMRAMSLAFSEDKKCDNYIHQYMFGDYFLVSAFVDKVYLPKGEWIDYWTGRRTKGPIETPTEFPENRGGPLFVKAGAIIPTQEDCDCIGTDTPEKIIWEIFPCENSSFTLREDDGESFEYLEGQIAETLLECSEEDKQISVTIHPRKGSYSSMPETRLHELQIHCDNKPAEASSDWKYDEVLKILTVKPVQEKKENIVIKISS